MDGIITDIKRMSTHDGDGIRTTIFLKGCPLRCLWCHNPETQSELAQIKLIQKKCSNCGKCLAVCSCHSITDGIHLIDRSRCVGCARCVEVCPNNALEIQGRTISSDNVVKIALEDVQFYSVSGGGVTISGGEPLMQYNFCTEILSKLKSYGIHTALDTCGCSPQSSVAQVADYTDIFLYDIKAIDESVHLKCTGRGNEQILDNLKYLEKISKPVEIRVPYIPGYNSDQIEKIGLFLSPMKVIKKVKVLPYHNLAKSKYDSLGMKFRSEIRVPSNSEIDSAVLKLKKFGLNAVNGNL